MALFTTPTTTSMEMVIWCMYIGLMLASVYMYYQKKVHGTFVRKLLEMGANDLDSAKTLHELGYSAHTPIRSALSSNSALRKLVWEAGDNYVENEAGVKISARETPMDVNTARFYIPEDNRIRAEIRYAQKGSDIFMLIITALVFLMIAVLAVNYLPTLLGKLGELQNLFQ